VIYSASRKSTILPCTSFVLFVSFVVKERI